jgi:hypothetical protein
MKLKNIVILSLIVSISFSIMHAYALNDINTNEHCTIEQYITEIQTPVNHGDICDIHFELHQTFLPLEKLCLNYIKHNLEKNIIKKEFYTFFNNKEFLKPPIV